MGTAITPRCIAVIVATLITVGIPFSTATAQGLEGCLGRGVSYPVDYYLPHLWGGWVIVSDERRNAEQLAATFADPADALARLHEWCWIAQAERVYVKDDLTVDVSIHDFLKSEGATLESARAQAQKWFGEQRANDLGLTRVDKTSEELEETLGSANIEALDNIVIDAYSNDSEYTLYARQGPGTSTQTGSHLPPDHVIRVTVSGDPSVTGNRREAVAYRVLAQIFGVNLFPLEMP